jgi:hypothetical protein
MFTDFFKKVSVFWNTYGFEILVVGSLIVIIVGAILQRDKKFVWRGVMLPENFGKPFEQKRGPPRESKGEIECRRVLEKLFRKPFSKERPNILQNPVTGGDNNLELDCYNDELKLAVEYNGIQHYKQIPYFHKTRDAFNNQKYRDYIKRDLCKKNGIILIEVPYTVKTENIQRYLIDQLKKLGYI